MATPPLETFTSAERAAIAEIVSEFSAAGNGWFNLSPDIPEDVPVPPTPGVLAVFSKRGPFVPVLTWIAGNQANGKKVLPQIGIQHGHSKRAMDALNDHDFSIPGDWRVLSDHPKRGCVIETTGSESHAEVTDWVCDLALTLCIPPTNGNFVVRRYSRER